jgi:hypothetical protein
MDVKTLVQLLVSINIARWYALLIPPLGYIHYINLDITYNVVDIKMHQNYETLRNMDQNEL